MMRLCILNIYANKKHSVFFVFIIILMLYITFFLLSCTEKSPLRIDSIEPMEVVECKGRFYKLRGIGFSNSTRIYPDIRIFCGSRPELKPDYKPSKVDKDGNWLEVFIRLYNHVDSDRIALTVIDGEKEGTLYNIPVKSCHAEIDQLVESLTLEELIGQTLMVGFDALEDDVRVSNRGLIEIIHEFKIGNAIIFKHNLPRVPDYTDPMAIPKWLARLTIDLQTTASESQEKGKKIPLIIAIDQEGGSGNILRGPGFTQVPEHTFIGITRKPQLAREAGRIIGAGLKYLGVNANLAPIADIITTNYDRIKELNHNPAIGIRAFGAYRELVTEMSVQYMKGLQDRGVLSIAKHFPGHGTSLGNPHEILPNIGITTETELMKTCVSPFTFLIKNGVNGILTSHIMVTPWDKERPVTLSQEIIEKKLRNKLRFGGLIISDDMATMTGILKSEPSLSQPTGVDVYTRIDAIKLAYKAGHDIIILGHIYSDEKLKEKRWVHIRRKNPITRGQIREIINELKTLYRDGEGLKRLKEKVSRILFQKAVLFGFKNFENPAKWRVDFVREKYEGFLRNNHYVIDSIFEGSVVLLSEMGNVRDKVEDFQLFDENRGPLSSGMPLINAGDEIVFASPVHKKPDILAEAIRSKAKWLKKIEIIRMVYGFYTENAKKQAEKEWPGEHIEILKLLDPLGNFIFSEDDIRRNHFPSVRNESTVEARIERFRAAARVVDHFINQKVEQIINATQGKKLLIFAVVTRSQIEIIERLHNCLDQKLPNTHVIVLLFKEPYLVSRSIYQHKRITVLHLSAFPSLARAADVLVGEITPKPAQYSALNAPLMKIALSGGAPLEKYSIKEIHRPKPPPPWKPDIPVIVWTLFSSMLGGLLFYGIPRKKLRWTTTGSQCNTSELFWSVVAGLVTGLVLYFMFPLIKEFEIFGIILSQAKGFSRYVITFALAFFANVAWVKLIVSNK